MNRRTYTAKQAAGKRSRDIGAAGEQLTRFALQRAGLAEIERVHTPFRIHRNSAGKVENVSPMEKVSGDFRAIDPETGKSVLCEVKTRAGDRILWSDLEEHQVRALDAHAKHGAIALLSVVLSDKAILLRWPVSGFGKGKSIRILGGNLRLIGNGKGPRNPEAPSEEEAPASTVAGTNVHLLTMDSMANFA